LLLPEFSVAAAEDNLFRPDSQAFATPRATAADGIRLLQAAAATRVTTAIEEVDRGVATSTAKK